MIKVMINRVASIVSCMGVALYFFTIFHLRHAGLIWFYIADGKRATEWWFDSQILSNFLSLKLAKPQAIRISTRNATYIFQNTVREGLCGGTTFKPRTKQEPKNASAPAIYASFGHLIITDSLPCPWGKKAHFLHFLLLKINPLYIYGHFLWPPLCPY